MRTGAARGHVGHFHEAGFYGSDAEFRALIVPFAEEGIAAGEPVVIGYDDRKSDLLRSWLTDPSRVDFVGDDGLYASPARAIAAYRRLFEFHVAMGAGQIRIAGDVPHPGNGGRFEGWDRYESAVNTVWEGFPVWGRCLYDTTTTTTAVLDVVERAHPRIISPSGQRRASDRYQNPAVFEGLPYARDPLEDSAPLAELVNRPAADARHALAEIGRGRVPAAILQDLLIGVSETVTNAQRHGRPPTTMRIWAAPDRIVVTIHDTGHGPADRLAGLVPAPAGSTSDRRLGLGLWVMHQLDIDVALRHSADGFTVRLRHLPGKGRRGTLRERQYEHIKDSAKQRGESTGRAEEIAARVNKERARSGEAKTASRVSMQDMSPGRRGGLRSHRGAGGPTKAQLYAEARRRGVKGRSSMTKAQLARAVGR